MKSASQITLSKAWWKKEAPDGLRKSGAAFEKALDAYARAQGALKADARAIRAFEDALDDLLSAARQVAAEAKDLEKKEKDRKVREDLSNTVAVMGKPLARAVEAERDRIPEEEAEGQFANAEAHAAFIRKWAPRIRRGTVSFAVGMAGNRPEDMRFNFHASKDGRGLAAALRSEAGAKKFTFGKAGTLALAEAVGEEDAGARALCLHLEGRRIPGLAKRVRLMLKALGITQFSVVRILEGGAVVEGADESTPDDAPLEAVDLDAPEEPDADAPGEAGAGEGGGGEAGSGEGGGGDPAPAGTPAPPPDPAPAPGPVDAGALMARYAAAFGRVKAAMAGLDPEMAAQVKAALARYGQGLKSGDLALAASVVAALEACAGGDMGPIGQLGAAAPTDAGPAPVSMMRVRIRAGRPTPAAAV